MSVSECVHAFVCVSNYCADCIFIDVQPIMCDFETSDFCPITLLSVMCSENFQLISPTGAMGMDATFNSSKVLLSLYIYIIDNFTHIIKFCQVEF